MKRYAIKFTSFKTGTAKCFYFENEKKAFAFGRKVTYLDEAFPPTATMWREVQSKANFNWEFDYTFPTVNFNDGIISQEI